MRRDRPCGFVGLTVLHRRRSFMAEKGREPVSRKAYEKLADSYSARAPTKPHNAY